MTKTTLKCIQFSFYTIVFLLLFSHANSQRNDQEQAILLNLKQHWQNPESLSRWSTSSNTSHCTWPNITCNTDGSVTGISVQNMNITGTVPPFICNLNNLTTLDLSFNDMTSNDFPIALYNCSKLEYLDLSQNYFAGTVPNDIHRMARLRQLNIGANSFSGNIPASVGRLTELRILQLFLIQFNGSFPPEIGNLSNLEVLELGYMTRITTTLPSEFTKLRKLKYLWVASSNLVGEIPDTIGEMAALEHLDLSMNNLSGSIPSGLFMLKNLSVVYLYKNKLSGEIPRVVEASNIDVIDLSENSLTGTVPDDFGRLTKLSGLSLFFNQLSGKIPDGIGRLPGLIVLKLFNNKFSGTLSSDFGRYSMLELFQVASNYGLTGELPKHLGDNGRLVRVVASDNNFSGELPKSLGNCNNLIFVDVHNNRLFGNVPNGLWTLLHLDILILSHNSFTGELPERLSRNLSRLEMSHNRFSGEIPVGVSSWRNLVHLDASNNLINGAIPQELTALPHLTTLLLDRNQLSGSLPSDILSWKSLNVLNLSRNAISGQIPEKFGSLPVLIDLDLSENRLSGQIPPQLGLLKLTSLNLSSNHFTGTIPNEFENDAYASSFLNNPRLCANKPSLNIAECNSKTQNSSKTSSKLLAWIIGVPAALMGLVASFLVIRIYRKRMRVLDLAWKLTSFQRLNFTKFDILSGLTENNVIGCGGSGKVYCVSINPSRDCVAVKRIWSDKKLEQKLEKEFLAKVKILSSIRHPNIVKLLRCISSDNSKLLVYEYLENRSLDLWLNRKSRTTTVSGSIHNDILDWPQRLKIAVGAAQGLSYMHHDYSPPIVHRDLKSSNILLDSEFNAKIADFGVVKMLMKEGESATMSAVVGSYGYIAPEYAHTIRVNEKIDVYSFGVILLELATGRKASEGDEHTSLAEWAWRHFQEGNPIDDALDEEVRKPCNLDEMCHVFKLGIMCTGTLPSNRPSMKEVLKILLRCNQPLVYGEKYSPPLKNSECEKVLENNDATLASMV